jgi:hypothetical protein
MISKARYYNIINMGNKANCAWFLPGKKQAESGKLREVAIE